MRVEFEFPCYPPSVNGLFLSFKRGNKIMRVRTKDYNAWIKLVHELCNMRKDHDALKEMSGRPYRLEISLYATSWRAKSSGKAKKWDATNRIKSLEDAICSYYGWLDEYNIQTLVKKCIGESPSTRVVFEFVDDAYLT
jgi:hypothetical protein